MDSYTPHKFEGSEPTYEDFLRAWTMIAPPWLVGDDSFRARIWKELAEGQYRLFANDEGAAMAMVQPHPSGTFSDVIIGLSGGTEAALADLMHGIEEWGRWMGCARLIATPHPSMVGLFSSYGFQVSVMAKGLQ